jgi:hypothetical protein
MQDEKSTEAEAAKGCDVVHPLFDSGVVTVDGKVSGRLNAFTQAKQDSHDFDAQRKDAADAAQAEVRLRAIF